MNEILEQFKLTLYESWNKTDKALWDDFNNWHQAHMTERFDIGYGYDVSPHQYYIFHRQLTKEQSEIILYGLYGVYERNMKAAEKFVKHLEERITAITGEIKEISEYFSENGKGWKVHGEKANAIVLQIYAGGYNIVRLHVRFLIKAVK